VGSSGLAQPATQSPATGARNAPPSISPALLRYFLGYARFYVGRHMHAVRVSQGEKLRQLYGKPLLLYMNHPSWWDPMIAAVLAGCYLPGYLHYAPMEAVALQKYPFFRKLGFFGVTHNSFQSQRKLLEISTRVLSQSHSAMWITPQGRFSDVRERPLRIESGFIHLVRHAPQCVVLPVAIEYAFWEESKPEVLVRFGDPVSANELQHQPKAQQTLEFNLEQALDALQQAVIARDVSAFQILLRGNSGVGGVYDLWRRGKALLTGTTFNPEHGAGRL